ncbi:MAG: cytidine deaminase [Anaerovoracaceae bacterium]|nr:cytidine deaminase [Anaerovoracaceae bacterium]
MKYRELYEKALEVMPRAYAPFSRFKVGAALLTKDGEVFTGVNVENSSLGATICAERTAFVKAVSEGATEFEAIAVVSEEGEVWPCGICRQFMKEFCDDDFRVITGNDVDSLRLYTMDEILPEGFKL